MRKILIGGAGGAPSEGVIRSLLEVAQNEIIMGMGSEPSDLILSRAQKKFSVPVAGSPGYKDSLLAIIKENSPDLIHFQNDSEIFHASIFRDQIQELGTRIFMPNHEVIDTCVHKFSSYLAFKKAGIKVPENILIYDAKHLRMAFDQLGDAEGKIWLRYSGIGGGGVGSIATSDFELAKSWIDFHGGWRHFIAAEMLRKETITWTSLWNEGKLIVAQTRKRAGWVHGSRSVSGVTGVTKLGITTSDPVVDQIAINAIYAVSEEPHGIFGVDMAYDFNGIPNPTEINISRFFTTILFFTRAGLNIPEMFKNIALYGNEPELTKIVNPLPDNLCWFRGMDVEPLLLDLERFESLVAKW